MQSNKIFLCFCTRLFILFWGILKINAALALNILSMLSDKEKAFLEYWEENRIKEKSVIKQFFPGLPLGICLGIAILLLLDSGWYERANMVAQAQSNPIVLFIGIAAIIAFTGFFYKKFRWEMNEQAYKELKSKKEAEEKNAAANKNNI
jgi:hypothetical protein